MDPQNYQWHFENPQIVGDYNFIDDHKKFNKKHGKKSIDTNKDLKNNSLSVVSNQIPNLATSPDKKFLMEKNNSHVPRIQNNDPLEDIVPNKNFGLEINTAFNKNFYKLQQTNGLIEPKFAEEKNISFFGRLNINNEDLNKVNSIEVISINIKSYLFTTIKISNSFFPN